MTSVGKWVLLGLGRSALCDFPQQSNFGCYLVPTGLRNWRRWFAPGSQAARRPRHQGARLINLSQCLLSMLQIYLIQSFIFQSESILSLIILFLQQTILTKVKCVQSHTLINVHHCVDKFFNRPEIELTPSTACLEAGIGVKERIMIKLSCNLASHHLTRHAHSIGNELFVLLSTLETTNMLL